MYMYHRSFEFCLLIVHKCLYTHVHVHVVSQILLTCEIIYEISRINFVNPEKLKMFTCTIYCVLSMLLKQPCCVASSNIPIVFVFVFACEDAKVSNIHVHGLVLHVHVL